MRYGQTKLLTLFFVVVGTVVSCAPSIHNIYFDMQKAALYPIDFEGKNIAIYVSLYEHNDVADSLMKTRLASSMAVELEKRLLLEEGAIYVFNHYPDRDSTMNMGYIQSLSRQADSDLLIVVDTIAVDPFTFNNSATASGYAISYLFAPYRSIVKVYDGITARNLARLDEVDTVNWQLLTKSDIQMASLPDNQLNMLQLISDKIGESVAENFFPSWDTYSRSIFIYSGLLWQSAAGYAERFEWNKAISLWENELENENALKAAVAALNIAIACELTDRPELALEWVEYAERTYRSSGRTLSLSEYKLLLKQKIGEQER